jgi:2,3-bisphosphoglycerate-independent phosphoglycerate mutase
MKRIIIIIDGMGDSAYKELGGKTPLEKAKTPNMDFLASNGKVGMMWPISKKIAPESDQAMIALLGFDPFQTYTGRGVLEAYGSGIKMEGVVARCNFSTETKKGVIIKVQGATEKQVKQYAKILNDDKVKIVPTVGYRAVMMIKTKSSPRVSNTHPGYTIIKNYVSTANPIKGRRLIVKRCRALEKDAEPTAKMINDFTKKTEEKIKEHTILIRGAGNRLPKLGKLKGRWALLADMPVEKGVGRIVGMKILPKSIDLKKTFNTIKKNFNKYDNFYMQIKGPDTFAHQGDVKGKIKAIEKIDREFIGRIIKLDAKICVTADHSTECKLKAHSKLPVPILIYTKNKGKAKKFCEKECRRGFKIYGKELLKVTHP